MFTAKGRLNRLRYFTYILILAILAGVVGALCELFLPPLGEMPPELLSAIAKLPFNILIIMQAIRRLHDLGRSGWHFLLMLVPFYNIYLALVLLFKKGDAGDNQFGDDPLAQMVA